ncbi:hypothetical protein Patl1_26562 [Pistacia atlantica]|uniref:Uncharacterized protein n=1 Tax=Pistacia atlantica TaxID=434234 RepID=A0ACC1B0E5_9ROSI|nr:hypothetical protein Patl1_26562 [Pistacia atlantica]
METFLKKLTIIDVSCRIEIPVEFQMMSPSSSTETMEEEHRRKEDNILVQIVLSSLFILLNSTYGMYGPGFLFKGTVKSFFSSIVSLIFSQVSQIRQRMLSPPSSQPPSSSSIDSEIQAAVVADQNYNQFLHQWKNYRHRILLHISI